MCGIGGIVGGGPPDVSTLSRMSQAMEHRGPDGEGIWCDEDAGLAFRRLAIIDLDPRSDQPLHLGDLHLVFNGEIYNYVELRDDLRRAGHRFHTEGDGEVLLHAWSEWGEQALDRLNGMFAFAIWNARERSLVLASDPFGEKPVYWASRGDGLVFASELRAVIEADRSLSSPDDGATAIFVALGLLPPIERTFFAGVSRLPGAHLLRWQEGRIEVRRYWWPERREAPTSYGDAVEQLRELLLDSIRLRLRSDVPVGTSLSGGVDSSAILTLAASIAGEHRRHAFTASFPGSPRDEWALAQEVASAAGVAEHHRVSPIAEDLLRDLDRLVRDQEEPFMTTSIYAQWRVMSAAREAGVTVLLDGQGADELFGGYDVSGGWALRSRGSGALLAGLIAGPRRLERAKSLGYDTLPAVLARRYRRTQASPYASREAIAMAETIAPPTIPERSPMRRELLREAFHTSLPGLLRFADRDSMAHSREVRLPFLDRRVAEFALSLPPEFLYRDGLTKRVLRDAVADLVPADVLQRREKLRFETPERAWFATPAFVRRAREVLLDSTASHHGLYNTKAIAADAGAGTWRSAPSLWRAMNVELWRAAFAARRRTARELHI